MKHVNIVMPVHNRWELTKQSIDSLVANTPQGAYDLTVIDDGSDEATGALLKELIQHYRNKNIHIHFINHQKPLSPGVSRNEATKMLDSKNHRAAYLYHSDNDVYFAPRWLTSLMFVYEEAVKHDVILLGGGCHPYLQNKEVIKINDAFSVGIKDAVSGYSQFMSWTVWDKYGLFDETMKDADKKIMGSEDWAYCQKLVQDGYKVGSLEPEMVYHCGRTNTYNELATGHEVIPNREGVIVL